jgi:hypothetical protein
MGRFETIRTLLAGHAGGARSFVKTLDDGGLAHLSWSKVSCVESCPYGYYLEGQFVLVERARRRPFGRQLAWRVSGSPISDH